MIITKKYALFTGFIRYFNSKSLLSSNEYCVNLVKKYDYENFMCTLLLKGSTRASAFAIRGFNVEVSKAGEQVTQPTTGQMRYKFWKELLDKCYEQDFEKIPKHPVAYELFKVLKRTDLTKGFFNNLITSRNDFMSKKSFDTLEDMEKYCDKTVSNVFFLLFEAVGIKDKDADHAASHLGKAQGIAQLLRTVKYAKHLNIVAIPQDILNKHKVTHEEVFRGKPSERLTECVFEVATRAHQHLKKARSLSEKVPPAGRSMLLPAVSVNDFLVTLQNVGYDLYDSKLKHRSWSWAPKLYLAGVSNKY